MTESDTSASSHPHTEDLLQTGLLAWISKTCKQFQSALSHRILRRLGQRTMRPPQLRHALLRFRSVWEQHRVAECLTYQAAHPGLLSFRKLRPKKERPRFPGKPNTRQTHCGQYSTS